MGPTSATVKQQFMVPVGAPSPRILPFRRLFSFPICSPWKPSFQVQSNKSRDVGGPAFDNVFLQDEQEEDKEVDQADFLDEFEDDSIWSGDENELQIEFLEEEEEEEIRAGDGGQGGGVSLVGTWWDKKALKLAEEVCFSFNDELGLYAFKTLMNSTIRVRIEILTNKSGCPDMNDIEEFSKLYREKLDEAERDKSIPEDITLEVSSPGVERRVRIPEDLERFKDRPMIVKYANEENLNTESEDILKLISVDMETESCMWGLADVRKNREKAGKGRPLNKKQREWRLLLPFSSMLLVRIYSEC